MSTGLIIFLVVLFIVTLVATYYAFKQEEKKMKEYEEKGETPEEELKRSLEYEASSLKSNISLQVWIYIVTLILAAVLFVWYIS